MSRCSGGNGVVQIMRVSMFRPLEITPVDATWFVAYIYSEPDKTGEVSGGKVCPAVIPAVASSWPCVWAQ